MIFLSPGVKTEEQDFSTYVGQTSSCIVGLVGGGRKGPIGEATLCTSPANFVEQFGEPNKCDFGALAAIQFLQRGNQLYYVRMAESNVKAAEGVLSGGLIVARAKEMGTNGNIFSVEIKDVKNKDFTLVIYKNSVAEETFEASIDESSENFVEKVGSYWMEFEYYDDFSADVPELLAVSTPTTAFTRNAENEWHVKAQKSSGKLETISFDVSQRVAATKLLWKEDTQKVILAPQPAATDAVLGDGETTRTGLTLVKTGANTFALDGRLVEGLVPNPELFEVPADVQGAVDISKFVSIGFSLAGLVPAGTQAGATVTLVQRNMAILDFYTKPELEKNPDFTFGDNDLPIKTKSYPASVLLGDTIEVLLTKDVKSLELEVGGNKAIIDTSHIAWSAEEVLNPVEVESYTTKPANTEAAELLFDGQHVTVNFTEPLDFSKGPWDKVFTISLRTANGLETQEVIRITGVEDGQSTQTDNSGTGPQTIVQQTLTLKASTAKLSGGCDGLPLKPGTVIGTGTSGLQAFTNVDVLDVNIIAAPGFYDEIVLNELLTICENRTDCIAVLDTPSGLTPQQALAFHNGELEGDGYPRKALNTSYGAIFYPWVQIYDRYSGENIWCPPSGVVLAQMAYNDSVGQPWFAPAGLNRGMLTSVLAVERDLDAGSRDALYGNGNNVNAIVNYKRQGITIWGQKTLQRKTSALDRINVRRLMCMVRKAIAISSAYMVFEQNDPLTWRKWKGTVDPYLESIKNSRGMVDFMTVMDETTVTPYHQDRNEMPGVVYIKPTKTAEFIPISFILTSQGALFGDETA